MHTLGIWDGHDAGAALLKNNKVIFAIQEERLSRRKLEVGFPWRSIDLCLSSAGLSPKDVKNIGVSTTDPAKTLTRIFPGLKEEYYLLRRRKKTPGTLDPLKKRFKYWFTELKPNAISGNLSRIYLDRQLKALGFQNYNLHLIDHHESHAQTAARCSGFEEAVILTLDGVGDGLAGSIWRYENTRLHILAKMPAQSSLGIFFEHVTNLMNMRELEDEGKVMALANYAYPVADQDNPMMKLLEAKGLQLVSRYRSWAMYKELKKILWRYPSEQFAFMAQRTLEKNVVKLAREAVRVAGTKNMALAGGIFSNIKLNKLIAKQQEVEKVFVFPNMGDGGLALGAALAADCLDVRQQSSPGKLQSYKLPDLYLGPQYSRENIVAALKKFGLSGRLIDNKTTVAADLLLKGEIILWFQGRLEYGPRSLGNRSILARPDDKEIKNKLNLLQKKRVWYQPFCPSMLEEDAKLLLDLAGRHDVAQNRYMTTAFRVHRQYLNIMAGVINIDGTCRPHLVKDENPAFRELLLHIKQKLGIGVVLNTSFNIHGEPVVCTPDDALNMFIRTDIRYLFLEDFLVEK